LVQQELQRERSEGRKVARKIQHSDWMLRGTQTGETSSRKVLTEIHLFQRHSLRLFFEDGTTEIVRGEEMVIFHHIQSIVQQNEELKAGILVKIFGKLLACRQKRLREQDSNQQPKKIYFLKSI